MLDVADSPKIDVPSSEEFARTLGHVTWLMTLSPDHKSRDISYIEAHVSAPLMFKQVRVYMRDKQPVAAVIWAYVSAEVKAKLDAGDYRMTLQDWRSGPEVAIVDCVSPLADKELFVKQFMDAVETAKATRRP